MYLRVVFNLLFIFFFTATQGKLPHQGFDRSAFYKAIASGNITKINAQLSIVGETLIPEREAFEGTLLMKKAGMVNKPKDKLSLFKSGRLKLESSILKDHNNTEYRFLRLLIQEHAPKIVRYRNQLEDDSENILTNFKNLSPVLQQVILDYSEKSTILRMPSP
jgi:hypothetical protein